MGARGRISTERNIELVAAYYSEQTKSNSHMVSEAALHAIKELSTRLSRSDVVKVLPLLVETLGACVQDHSWPVRDAAIGALGSLVVTFAAEISDMEAAGSLIIPGVGDDSNNVDGEAKERVRWPCCYECAAVSSRTQSPHGGYRGRGTS